MSTPSACPCGVALTSKTRWLALSRAERAASAVVEHKGRGMCSSCYHRAYRQGAHIDVPRASLSREDLLDEWQAYLEHTGRSRSHTQTVRDFAAYLGRPFPTIERALTRAGVRA